MIAALVLVPTLAALVSFALRRPWAARAVLLAAAIAHTGLTAWACVVGPAPSMEGWLALDATGLVFLSLISVLFLACAVYTVGYLRHQVSQMADTQEGFLFSHGRQATFVGCLLLFLAAMTLVTVAGHLGLIWVAIEATTLASAPLIYFHRHHRSLEATWKYLLICSVGIAVAMLGNFFLAVAAARGDSAQVHTSHLTLSSLLNSAGQLDKTWLKAAFILLLVGYGTKMGLAPMHTWLPDAHSEAPSVVSALLSGALLNCALLAILRVHSVLVAAGEGAFSSQLLVILGLTSLAVAAVFMVGQMDFKRMLAYSSVEHMGILALGVGIGGAAGYGAMLHAVNHSMAKGMLFLLAGNVLAACRTKHSPQITGLVSLLPVTGPLWLVGFLAIAGSPPFGTFMSEFMILRGALDSGRGWVAAFYLVALGVIFVAMGRVVLAMTYGRRRRDPIRIRSGLRRHCPKC
jgi:hydrogenase-4 component F